jgi:hypothetical protein
MCGAQDYGARAGHYAKLVRDAKSTAERDRFQRMQRSYSLMERSAQFTAVLDDLIAKLKHCPT